MPRKKYFAPRCYLISRGKDFILRGHGGRLRLNFLYAVAITKFHNREDKPMTRTRSLVKRRRFNPMVTLALFGVVGLATAWTVLAAPPKDQTYMPVVLTKSFEDIYKGDTDEKDEVLARQKALLEKRYDLSDNPSEVQMSGKRKAVQQGVRVKLTSGATWDRLNSMTP